MSEPIELVESESINADEEIADSGDVKELKEEHKTLIACVTAIVGTEVVVEKTDGSKLKGLLRGCSENFDIELLFAQKMTSHDQYEDLSLFDNGSRSTIIISSEVVALTCDKPEYLGTREFSIGGEIVLNGECSVAETTDTDEEELEAWQGDEEDDEHGHVISDETRGADGYNQRFTVEKMLKVNEDLGVKTSFKADLSQYTTVEPVGSEEDKRRAHKLAKEIERSANSKYRQMLENDDEERDLGVKTEFEKKRNVGKFGQILEKYDEERDLMVKTECAKKRNANKWVRTESEKKRSYNNYQYHQMRNDNEVRDLKMKTDYEKKRNEVKCVRTESEKKRNVNNGHQMENNDEQNLEVKTACEPEITIPVNGTPADAKDDVDDRSKKGLNVNAAVFVLTKSSANPTPSFSGSASADPALLPPTPQQFTQFPSRIHVQPTAIVNTATPLSHLPNLQNFGKMVAFSQPQGGIAQNMAISHPNWMQQQPIFISHPQQQIIVSQAQGVNSLIPQQHTQLTAIHMQPANQMQQGAINNGNGANRHNMGTHDDNRMQPPPGSVSLPQNIMNAHQHARMQQMVMPTGTVPQGPQQVLYPNYIQLGRPQMIPQQHLGPQATLNAVPQTSGAFIPTPSAPQMFQPQMLNPQFSQMPLYYQNIIPQTGLPPPTISSGQIPQNPAGGFMGQTLYYPPNSNMPGILPLSIASGQQNITHDPHQA